MSKKKNEFELTTEEQVEIDYIIAKSHVNTTRNNLKDLVRLIDAAIGQNNLATKNYRKALIRRNRVGHEKRNVVTAWVKNIDMLCFWWGIKCSIYKSLYSKKVTDSEAWKSRDENPIQWH